MSPDQQARLVAYLRTYPFLAPHIAAAAQGRRYPITAQPLTAEQLGQLFLDDAQFRALALANWLNTPSGEVFADVVARVLPPSYEPIFTVTVDALQFAAREQTFEGRRRAAALALGVATVGVMVALAKDS